MGAGNQGMGTYFADDAATTGYKSRHYGCVIKLLARLGTVYDMGDKWINDMGRIQDGCDPLFGYTLMHEGFDSITTIKHGRERALFFDDQILDMVAYPCPAFWNNNGQPTGPYLNGRDELKYPDSCDPDDYPELVPPPCKFDGGLQRQACAGFTSAGCFSRADGNVEDAATCTGAAVLRQESLDWYSCEKHCFDDPKCKGFQFAGNQCIQYSDVPTAVHGG